MAMVREFFRATINTGQHSTEVDCGYQLIITKDGNLLQLNTYGSDNRQSKKKTSQTLQLDQEHAAELLKIITDAFPELK
ncbi:hypothetical protein OHA77_23875 [Streptosporangium sp. NBC_01639]|uniref:hypothetical protein n=1 Tax=Streptosporangium sp. NBC_01639 TaxID=2975948 RepID=UPI003863A0BD|nr:hypothetical protein OHA77_23875 [Streptosporangium sp. NBC_01639]